MDEGAVRKAGLADRAPRPPDQKRIVLITVRDGSGARQSDNNLAVAGSQINSALAGYNAKTAYRAPESAVPRWKKYRAAFKRDKRYRS